MLMRRSRSVSDRAILFQSLHETYADNIWLDVLLPVQATTAKLTDTLFKTVRTRARSSDYAPALLPSTSATRLLYDLSCLPALTERSSSAFLYLSHSTIQPSVLLFLIGSHVISQFFLLQPRIGSVILLHRMPRFASPNAAKLSRSYEIQERYMIMTRGWKPRKQART